MLSKGLFSKRQLIFGTREDSVKALKRTFVILDCGLSLSQDSHITGCSWFGPCLVVWTSELIVMKFERFFPKVSNINLQLRLVMMHKSLANSTNSEINVRINVRYFNILDMCVEFIKLHQIWYFFSKWIFLEISSKIIEFFRKLYFQFQTLFSRPSNPEKYSSNKDSCFELNS